MDRVKAVSKTLETIRKQADNGWLPDIQIITSLLTEIAVSLAVIADCMVEDLKHK